MINGEGSALKRGAYLCVARILVLFMDSDVVECGHENERSVPVTNVFVGAGAVIVCVADGSGFGDECGIASL